jgi:hypothetical protein
MMKPLLIVINELDHGLWGEKVPGGIGSLVPGDPP